MKLNLLLVNILIVLCLISQNAFSQDTIVLKNGKEIKAVVSDIEFEVIKYKKFENISGPNYTLKKSEISMIKYANGTKDVFGGEAGQNNEAPAAFQTFTDARDGKTYKTVTIGSQTWMAENLAFKADKGCWAYDDNEANVATYGYLYDWETAKRVCPAGWHLPSEAEWQTLFALLGGKYAAAKKLKSTSGWTIDTKLKNESESFTPKQKARNAKNYIIYDGNGTNESGFNALPGGSRGGTKAYSKIGVNGYWWSSTQDYDYNADRTSWAMWLYSKYDFLDWVCLTFWDFGLSVRCVKD
ncbi:MAG TPA: fibrobacter succinogenes major paralogous domain-containing protein [Bacteroidales bacterium]|nr:fibrobacter succinogenes major paralogous domain-containing protein [Bacteroidales bacterium]